MPENRPEPAIADPLLGELKTLVGEGKRIEAIKRYRAATGSDLVTAHTAVARLSSTIPPAAAKSGPRTPQPLADKIAGLVGLLAFFSWACALLAGGAAGWQAYDRYIIRTSWPQIDADVVSCRIIDHRSRRNPPFQTLGCTYRYALDGREYTAETHSTGIASPEQVAVMQQWIAEHRRNPKQLVHYDPADPRRISLGDADAGFQADTVEHRLRLSGLFTVAGAAAFALARLLAARQQLRASSLQSFDQS